MRDYRDAGPFEDPDEDEEPTGRDGNKWLLSFVDVSALLLSFFVLIFSMSYFRTDQWNAVMELISSRDQTLDTRIYAPVSELNVESLKWTNALSSSYLHKIFSNTLGQDPVLNTALIYELDDRLVISLPNGRLFDEGAAAMRPEASEAISRMSGILAQLGNQVEIQGHTGPVPEANNRYRDNRELSLYRALATARALMDTGYSGNIAVFGVADTQFRHIDAAIPESRRRELSRRTDIVVQTSATGQ